jgi:hypothetical protein
LDVKRTPRERIVQRNEVLSCSTSIYISRPSLLLTASLKGPEGVCPRGKGSGGGRRHEMVDNAYRSLPAKS